MFSTSGKDMLQSLSRQGHRLAPQLQECSGELKRVERHLQSSSTTIENIIFRFIQIQTIVYRASDRIDPALFQTFNRLCNALRPACFDLFTTRSLLRDEMVVLCKEIEDHSTTILPSNANSFDKYCIGITTLDASVAELDKDGAGYTQYLLEARETMRGYRLLIYILSEQLYSFEAMTKVVRTRSESLYKALIVFKTGLKQLYDCMNSPQTFPPGADEEEEGDEQAMDAIKAIFDMGQTTSTEALRNVLRDLIPTFRRLKDQYFY